MIDELVKAATILDAGSTEPGQVTVLAGGLCSEVTIFRLIDDDFQEATGIPLLF